MPFTVGITLLVAYEASPILVRNHLVHIPSRKVTHVAERLTPDCLRNLEKLAKLEFAVSFQQQVDTKVSKAASKDAYAFDVCLVRHGSQSKNSMMVLVPKEKEFF